MKARYQEIQTNKHLIIVDNDAEINLRDFKTPVYWNGLNWIDTPEKIAKAGIYVLEKGEDKRHPIIRIKAKDRGEKFDLVLTLNYNLSPKDFKVIIGAHPEIAGLLGNSNRYKKEKGEISLIHPCKATMDNYEIYCIKGELFEDIERFSTLEEAEERITELLGVGSGTVAICGIHNDKCHCPNEIKTGTVSIHCCNLCGKPDEDWWGKRDF